MSGAQRTSVTPSPVGSFEIEGLESRQLLSFVFVSSGGGLLFSVGSGGHHHHDHVSHHHHSGVSIVVSFNNHTTLFPITDAPQTLFPAHFPALPLPSFMPMT